MSDASQTITKDGSDLVSDWADYLGSGNDLVQGTGADQPVWSSDGILFDGVSDFMKVTAGFLYPQPEMIYIVVKQISWSSFDRFFDGDVGDRNQLIQTDGTPNLIMRSSGSSTSDSLALNTFGIVRSLTNGANSTFQINDNTLINWIATNFAMNGFVLGARGSVANFSNIQVKEVILRNVDDTDATEEAIYLYLKRKYGLSPNGLIFMFMLMLYIGNRKRFNEKKLYI